MKKKTVLIADDNPHMRSALRLRMQSMGYQVIEAVDGLGVLGRWPDEGVHLVMLDHDMPRGDGRTVARFIRHESDVPIIFISGYPREDFRPVVTDLPDVYYLSKPLDQDKFAHLVTALLEREPIRVAG